ncbi:MAG TPA: type II toxin-antitoxin system death-on-curing family toxin [Allosphingosinicella sp.]|jgi:death-on-curing protein
MKPEEPQWVRRDVALAIHDRQLSEHGGGVGLRDTGAFESALARPANKWTYGEEDLATLAAAYAFGVARNHPFVDGNKRTAWVLSRLFLAQNGVLLRYDRQDAIDTMLKLAAGELNEEGLADWFRQGFVDRAQI